METIISLPENVTAKKEGHFLIVEGPNGVIKKKFLEPNISIIVDKNQIKVTTESKKKKVSATYNSWLAHIKNMITGAQKDWVYKLKVVYTHFPITLKQEGNVLKIENFFGERKPRKAKILPGVKLKLSKTDVEVSGCDIEAVGQTAANIEQATRITNRDRRRFQDGIYIIEKPKWVKG